MKRDLLHDFDYSEISDVLPDLKKSRIVGDHCKLYHLIVLYLYFLIIDLI